MTMMRLQQQQVPQWQQPPPIPMVQIRQTVVMMYRLVLGLVLPNWEEGD